MIKLSDREKTWLCEEFELLLNPRQDDEDLMIFVGNLDKATLQNVRELFELRELWNYDEEINENLISTIYYMFFENWIDNDMDAEEVVEFITEPEYISIYQKLL